MAFLVRHRLSLALGVIFVADGLVYWVAQAFLGARRVDMTGVVALVALGAAMAFTFAILMSGNRSDGGGGEPAE